MPYNARRGSFKIVEQTGDNLAPDLSVGIINALEKGAKLEEIRRSYLNAGYSIEEVNLATLKAQGRAPIVIEKKLEKKIEIPVFQKKTQQAIIQPTYSTTIKPQPKLEPMYAQPVIQPKIIPQKMKSLPITKASMSEQIYPATKPLPAYPLREKEETSMNLVIMLLVLSMLILVGASILGLYWDRLF